MECINTIYDPRTNQCELEVQKIIHLQGIANQLPDAFTDINRVTKSHIPAENAPSKIEVPEGQIIKANASGPRIKRGRPLGSKDKNPRKRKGAKSEDIQIEKIKSLEKTPEETRDTIVETPEEGQVPENIENDEISINYVFMGKRWN